MRSKWQQAIEQHRKRMESRPMRCSIVMSTYNKPVLLARTLDSIIRQRVPFRYETIVVDDGSDGTATRDVCQARNVTYHRIEREATYRNPGPARNVGYRMATGEIIIAQSDEVIHDTLNTIEKLASVPAGEAHFATVWNADYSDSGVLMRCRECYCGAERPVGFFFLGSLHRKALYAVGGNDERLNLPGFDDNLFADMLQHHGVKFVFRDDVIGYHQSHPRPRLREFYRQMEIVYKQRLAECEASGDWTATGGAWQV